MAEKVLKTKITLLYKTAAEWDAIQDTYKPLKGEVCFCDVPNSSEAEHAVLFKVGNGEDEFRKLPWVSALAADIFPWAKKEHLNFNDLDQEFLDAMMEYIGGSEENTQYKLQELDEGGNHIVRLLYSDDGIHWNVVAGSANIDLGSIDEAIAAEAARAQAEEAKKVDREVVSGNNTSLIFNEADGGGAQITTATNKGFAGVHDGSNPDQTYATMYVKNADGSQTLARIDLDGDGKAYYLKGGASKEAGSEIAVKSDIVALSTGLEIKKEAQAEEGYFATYKLVDADEIQHGASINIPKDFLVKSAELKTVETEDEPYPGAHVGDKYIDFVVNVAEGSATDKHIYLPVNDLVDTYVGGHAIEINAQNEVNFIASDLDDDEIAQSKIANLEEDLGALEAADEALDVKIDAEIDRAEAKENELEEKIGNLTIPHEPELVGDVLYANGNALRITDDGSKNIAHYSIISGSEKTIEFPYNATVFAGGKGTADKFANFDMGELVIDGGKFKSIYGGSEFFGSVANTVIIFNNGNASSGIIGGGKAGNANDINQVGKAIVKFNGGEASTVYGGAHGHGNVAECELEINGGHAQYVTVGGSNGLTGVGKAIIKGGNIDVFQTVNRGYIEDAKAIVEGGNITKFYAGGETEDSGVDGKAEKVNLQLLGGNLKLYLGSYGGVEDASRCTGDYNTGVITAAEAAAFNGRLVENCLILDCNL